MLHIPRPRRHAPSLLAAFVLLGVAVPAAQAVSTKIAVTCTGTFHDDVIGRFVHVQGEVPSETAPGQPVALTNGSASLEMIHTGAYRSSRNLAVYASSLTFSFDGGRPSNYDVPGFASVVTIPSMPSHEPGSTWTTAFPIGEPTTVTDGHADVAIRLGTITFGAKLDDHPNPGTDDDPAVQTCTPSAGQPPVATIRNTAPKPTPTPTPEPTSVPHPVADSTINGNVTFAGPTVRGTMPFRGRLDDTTYAREAGTFTGRLSLSPASAGLMVGGFLPVTARMEFAVAEPLTGRWGNGPIDAEAQVAIKVPRVSLFGIQLGGGANCRAKDVSSLKLLATGADDDPAYGSLLTGTLPIGPLAGCGILNGVMSQLLVGEGHAVGLHLRPAAVS